MSVVINISMTVLHDDLNTSDHLPIVADMLYAPPVLDEPTSLLPSRVDWEQARNSCLIQEYSHSIGRGLAPLLTNSHGSIEDMNRELEYITKFLLDTAKKTLLTLQVQI